MTDPTQLSPDLLKSTKKVAKELLETFKWKENQAAILKEQIEKGYVVKTHGEIAKIFERVIPANANEMGVYVVGWGASIKVKKRIALTLL